MVLPLGSRVIYGLVDPRTGVVSYVGVTDNPSRRFSDHLRAKEKGQAKLTAWVNELRAENLQPIFVFLDSIRTKDALQSELEWIGHFQKIAPLYNHKKK